MLQFKKCSLVSVFFCLILTVPLSAVAGKYENLDPSKIECLDKSLDPNGIYSMLTHGRYNQPVSGLFIRYDGKVIFSAPMSEVILRDNFEEEIQRIARASADCKSRVNAAKEEGKGITIETDGGSVTKIAIVTVVPADLKEDLQFIARMLKSTRGGPPGYVQRVSMEASERLEKLISDMGTPNSSGSSSANAGSGS